MVNYDYLIVGAGLFGAVFAHEMHKKGKKCLVIDKRSHSGGNVFCENIEGINVHKYGAHIFHTNDKDIWDYVNSFVEFNRYTNSPMANYNGELFNLPFNMNTFYQLWGVKTPKEAQEKIKEQVEKLNIKKPTNLEEQALSLVGSDIYEKLIKGYTEKQWGRKATELPAFIIKRLPVRFTYDNNYFNDKYQGIPIGGYNKLIDALLEGVEVRLNSDFFKNRMEWMAIAKKIVFSGKIDEFYDFKYGNLEYRSLRFEHSILNEENYQGNAVVNYTAFDVPYTRIIEHKHFEFGKQVKTVITKEYPDKYDDGKEAYYPVNDEKNMELFKKYSTLAKAERNVIFGGRLAEYRYYDMHQVIATALKVTREC
ncbi:MULTISPECIES: UDP-galactopyranose mutase [unclassified Sphingobacterium]|uniref:UDP-galactopyranose mutase n=1 Tax=unclassified Sphingobacterium TaxID=2609468 RepID=UPI0025F813FA|nr:MULTISPECIES: UDP-galactopyranose mutase [unclassified Sphingobacterium]